MKIKLRDDSFRMKGWAAFFNKLAWIAIFPIRRPLIFLGIVAVLYIVPIFVGVKPTEVHVWYWQYIKNYTSVATNTVSRKTKGIIPEQITKVVITKPGNSIIVKPDVMKKTQEVSRKSFGRLEGDVQRQDALANQEIVRLPQAEKIIVQEAKIVDTSISAKKSQATVNNVPKIQKLQIQGKKLALVYLETPENVRGAAEVINANELVVNGKHLFLYGIYVDPNTQNGIDAKSYLKMLLDGKNVICQIVAYTYQNIPTAFCNVGDIGINQTLVDKGYSKNVAL